MPQNIVVGDEAEAVAEFVAEYAGGDAERAAATGHRVGLASRRPRPARRPVLDLGAIREDPGRPGRRWRAAAPPRRSTSCCALDDRRRELLPEVEGRARAPEPASDADRGGEARRARTPRR